MPPLACVVLRQSLDLRVGGWGPPYINFAKQLQEPFPLWASMAILTQFLFRTTFGLALAMALTSPRSHQRLLSESSVCAAGIERPVDIGRAGGARPVQRLAGGRRRSDQLFWRSGMAV